MSMSRATKTPSEIIEEELPGLFSYELEDPTEYPKDLIAYRTPEGDSVLHLAASIGSVAAIEAALCLGLDINMKGDMSYTPLHYAVARKHAAAVRFLIDHGADCEAINEFGRRAYPGD